VLDAEAESKHMVREVGARSSRSRVRRSRVLGWSRSLRGAVMSVLGASMSDAGHTLSPCSTFLSFDL
jgi:hypothetical protein